MAKKKKAEPEFIGNRKLLFERLMKELEADEWRFVDLQREAGLTIEYLGGHDRGAFLKLAKCPITKKLWRIAPHVFIVLM